MERRGKYSRIPICFIGGFPVIQLEIEGNSLPVKLDLGSSCQIALNEQALQRISQKKFIGLFDTRDVKGNLYKEACFTVPSIRVKNYEIEGGTIFQESLDFVNSGSLLWKPPGEEKKILPIEGRVGRRFFPSHNLLLDLPNSMLFITDSLDELKKDFWPISDFIEIPFEVNRWGIILRVETDSGQKKLILDTAATVTILKKGNEETQFDEQGRQTILTEKFIIGEQNFGPKQLFIFDIAEDMPADGILGLDFLNRYALFVNFRDSKLLIGSSKEICGEIFVL